ncbi:TonB-dependent receptor [Kordiimonas pumila]|uniref:TonB-dependent receptor n=1 Tax=Kordiimonas pumila TaxID=2161677 RepID=A0ABV7D8B3_9PROT|nr:TonB-dependent receptor [Kordiimonas pumila]
MPYNPATAEGNEDAESVGVFDEIIVTARRRSESLQDVPIAVTALTERDIARAGLEGVSDFANLVPNVTFSNSLNAGTNYLTIRGQTQSQYAAPPAAIVVDGVLTISPLQFNVDEFDLQQIEVLKGPQGAIYGRNAIAGAINLATLKPSDEFNAHFLAGYARGDEWKGKASISGAIVPGLLYALGGVSYTDRRGQVRNITTGTYSDKVEDLTARLRFVVTPSDDLELDLKYTYSDTDGRDPSFISSASGDPAISSDPLVSNRIGYNPRKLHDLSGKFSLDTSFATTTLTLAYVDIAEDIDEDLDYTTADFLAARQTQDVDGFSQELRFASNGDDKLDWLVGGYHVRSTEMRATEIYIDLFYLGLAPEPTQADFVLGSASDEYYYETWSGFGQVNYEFLPELSVSFELRYDDDSVRQVSLAEGEKQASFSKWQPKGTITYKPSSGDLTLYASIGKGYRSGDFNSSGASYGNPLIKAESATNYEVGAKSILFNGKVMLNMAVFQTDLADGQFKLFDSIGATNVGVNIDKTRIRGFEAESAVQVTENVRLNASIGYTDPKVTAFTPPTGFTGIASDYIGNRPPRTAKVTFNFGLDIDIPVTDNTYIFFRPDYRYIGGYYWDPENDYKRPAENVLNFRLGLRDLDEQWSITGYVQNALNEKITSDFQPFSNTGLPTGADVYYPPVGAVYGLELRYQF